MTCKDADDNNTAIDVDAAMQTKGDMTTSRSRGTGGRGADDEVMQQTAGQEAREAMVQTTR
jgi:hypothetical protein